MPESLEAIVSWFYIEANRNALAAFIGLLAVVGGIFLVLQANQSHRRTQVS